MAQDAMVDLELLCDRSLPDVDRDQGIEGVTASSQVPVKMVCALMRPTEEAHLPCSRIRQLRQRDSSRRQMCGAQTCSKQEIVSESAWFLYVVSQDPDSCDTT